MLCLSAAVEPRAQGGQFGAGTRGDHRQQPPRPSFASGLSSLGEDELPGD